MSECSKCCVVGLSTESMPGSKCSPALSYRTRVRDMLSRTRSYWGWCSAGVTVNRNGRGRLISMLSIRTWLYSSPWSSVLRSATSSSASGCRKIVSSKSFRI